ncbi:branched-chain amino acid transport system II carrier protein [Pseudoflavonifractor sp. MSJ-37]|uniref:branched-chain amino acid transport system II carrier protein n=1 Tax=Pseudoflavonifractor sp. MSJ-37 TaxID=2841531 RepID=UPI001C0F6472|nr:branched-chain amino acid transport system II carrier protein [Pseudoflavonifractor sp. MSJ-37]MBU5434958.1 branched-chain amino acid transport system II carrier protein [Pseudoflavonifractor sp. MSJ-37]
MKELKGRDLFLIGCTLFTMFFGAGNLIFPPAIAAQAGAMTWWAVIGLTVSAVGLPVLGVVAVARSGGMDALCGRVHPLFAKVFTVTAYLAIGPCLAIPRTASTSFEMAVPPFAGADAPMALFQFLYSAAFFALALLVALRPEKLTDRLGKIMCPLLILLVVVTFAACLADPLQGYGPAGAGYESPGKAVITGFLRGYQTMDVIAALAFGIVISLNIQARGIAPERAVVRGTIRAGAIAGVLLFLIYAMLAHIGALSGGAFPDPDNGAAALTNIVHALFGRRGDLLLAAIFVIACFNVCVGLICSCGEYFAELCPKIPYRGWAILFAIASMALANAGLDQILALSVPALNIIYPVAITLSLLSLFQSRLVGRDQVWPIVILFTGAASILLELLGLLAPALLDRIPLASLGLGWVLPALLGLIAGLLASRKAGR